MALIICESFDGVGTASSALLGKWTELNNLSSTLVTDGPHGLVVRGSTSDPVLRKALDTNQTDDVLYVGVRTRIMSAGTRQLMQFAADTNSTVHISIEGNANAGFNVRRGTFSGTVIATSANNVYPVGATYFYLEVKVKLSDTVGEVEIRVDGVTVLTFSGDTRNGGTNAVLDNVRITPHSQNVGGEFVRMDDIYILNEQTTDGFGNPSDLTGFLGDCRVEALQPNGNGNSSQFDGSDGNSVDNYLLVDEVTADDDTTYVQGDVDDEKDTYAFDNLVSTSGAVLAVQVVTRARKTDVGPRSVAHVVRADATELDSDDFTLSLSYAAQRAIFEHKPNTDDWTRADVDAAEFGVKARP